MGTLVPRFTVENESKNKLCVMVEMTPEKYTLEPGEKLEVLWSPNVNDPAPTFIWHGDCLTIYPEIMGDEEHRINGETSEGRSWVD